MLFIHTTATLTGRQALFYKALKRKTYVKQILYCVKQL